MATMPRQASQLLLHAGAANHAAVILSGVRPARHASCCLVLHNAPQQLSQDTLQTWGQKQERTDQLAISHFMCCCSLSCVRLRQHRVETACSIRSQCTQGTKGSCGCPGNAEHHSLAESTESHLWPLFRLHPQPNQLPGFQ